MPFDPHSASAVVTAGEVRTKNGSGVASDGRDRVVGLWLFSVCGMILVMITLGGATRLTGSGLSIMEWAPLHGILPPLSDAEWRRLFGLYRQIPQYALIHDGFGLDGFKQIFWLEWTHRLWGRLIGLAVLVPLIVFVARGRIARPLGLRLFGLFLLGGLQGAIGWFMVASGFMADSTSVSAYRLVVHLCLALSLYVAMLWTALSVWQPTPIRKGAQNAEQRLRRWVIASAWMVSVTIVAGGFVAGLHAGLTYNTFPLMDGQLVPDGYGRLSPLLRNLTENVAAVQFDHRLLATLTALIVAATVWIGLRGPVARPVRVAVAALGLAVTAQYLLGVITLIGVVPWTLGTAHQGVAVLLLTVVVVTRHTLRVPSADSDPPIASPKPA